jgi:ABC-2 type transport system permease protein
VAQRVLGDSAERLNVLAAVGFATGMVLLTAVTVGATAYAGRKLQTLRLNDDS